MASPSSLDVSSSVLGNPSSSTLFTPEQWKALAGIFGNAPVSTNRLNGKFDNTLWIIETGATHRFTSNDSWLFDVKNYDCPVGLPNGASVISTVVGSACLTSHITLKNVLFVPNLSCNLLSVSQLSDDLECDVQFNSSLCVIQDPMKALIGTGIRKDKLYILLCGHYFHPPCLNSFCYGASQNGSSI